VHPPATVRVLSVSDYESIRISRELLLQSSGYSVISISSDCALRCEIPQGLTIAVIGQTVNGNTAFRIAARLQQSQPNVRILRLTTQYSRSGPGFTSDCFVEDGPKVFLSRVAELVATCIADGIGTQPIQASAELSTAPVSLFQGLRPHGGKTSRVFAM
jgi:hypothetical protein